MVQKLKLDFEEDPTFKICVKEHWITWIFWFIQSFVMLGVFYFLGYHRVDDPLNWPLGLPSWYLLGGVIPAIVSLLVLTWWLFKHYNDFPLE